MASSHNITRADTVRVGAAYNPGVNGYGYVTSIGAFQDLGALEAASTTNVANNVAAVISTNLSLVSSTVTFNIARGLQIQSNQNLAGATFTAYGTDRWGQPVAETITGPNNSTAYGTKAFLTVNRVVPSANGSNVNIGMSNVIGLDYRVDYAGQIVVQMGSRLLDSYQVHVKVTNLAAAENQVYISPTGGSITAIRAASAANNANNNATFTIFANGTSVGNVVVLSNYVANTVVSNNTPTVGYFAPLDPLRIQASGATNGSTGPVDVELTVDPALLTAGNILAANATTTDVRGTINLGTAPNASRRFIIAYNKLDASTDAALYGVPQFAG